jgi:hypothetical protein
LGPRSFQELGLEIKGRGVLNGDPVPYADVMGMFTIRGRCFKGLAPSKETL